MTKPDFCLYSGYREGCEKQPTCYSCSYNEINLLKQRPPCENPEYIKGFKKAQEQAAAIAAPYHIYISGDNDEDGCPRFCTICKERRLIRDKILEMELEISK